MKINTTHMFRASKNVKINFIKKKLSFGCLETSPGESCMGATIGNSLHQNYEGAQFPH